MRRRKEEAGSYFHFASEKQGGSEADMLKEAVRVLEERVDKLNERVYFLEDGGEEKGSSSSEDGYEKDWRWENGGWWCSCECDVQEESF